MKEVKKIVEPDHTEEGDTEDMIEKYLTDSLSQSEKDLFRKLSATDLEFRRNLALNLAALAITDSALDTPI